MSKIKILLVAVFCFSLASSAFSQAQISPERKRAIDSLAMEKIRDLTPLFDKRSQNQSNKINNNPNSEEFV